MRKILSIIKADKWVLAGLVVLSLAPLLWFQPDKIITGTDVDFALFPQERFLERTHTWYPGVLGGADRSNNVASLPFLAPSLLFDSLGFGIITVEKLTFIYWMLLIGFAMYFLMKMLVRPGAPGEKFATFFAILIYQFSFYQVFIWVRLQTAFSAVILFPILIGVFIGLAQKRIRMAHAFLIVSLTAIVTGSMGIQPPHIFILLMALGLLVLFVLAQQFFRRQFKEAGRLLLKYVGVGTTYVLASSFWELPLANFILKAGYAAGDLGRETYSVDSLLAWVGKETSFLNVFRFFGDIVWFDSWGGERYFPDFIQYQQSPALIVASFLLPIIVLGAFLLPGRVRNGIIPKYSAFFGILVMLGLFFSKGTHEPLGDAYLWMVDHVPFFWIQRAPWQKFALVTLIGYAVLGGLFLGAALAWLKEKLKNLKGKTGNYVVISSALLVVAVLLGYHHVFLFGKMFSGSQGDVGYHEKFNLGFHHSFPQYLFEAREWVNSQPEDFKLLLLPDDKSNVFNWGYGGAATVSSYLFNKGIISRQYGEGLSPPHSVEQVSGLFISSLYHDLTPRAAMLLRMLGVGYVLQRNDFRYGFYGDADSPEFIRQRLEKQEGLALAKSFGQWDFYQVENSYPAMYVPTSIYSTTHQTDALLSLLNSPHWSTGEGLPAFLFERPDGTLSELASRVETQNLDEIVIQDRVPVPLSDGSEKSFSWSEESLGDAGASDLRVEARSYAGRKEVIGDKENGQDDTLVFSSPEEFPYKLPEGSREWFSFDGTLIYIETSDRPLHINRIIEGSDRIIDIVGVWWLTDWYGAGTKDVIFPLSIPARQRAIVQVNHIASDPLYLELSAKVDPVAIISQEFQRESPTVEYQHKNPTQYSVTLRGAKEPFVLATTENFHPDWRLYFQGSRLGDHVVVNGYANAWVVDPSDLCSGHPGQCAGSAQDGYDLSFEMEFWPQRLFYLGLGISGITVLLSIAYASFFGIRRRRVLKREDE